MGNIFFRALLLVLCLSSLQVSAQYLITPSNKCFNQIQDGNAFNDSHQYQEAKETFEKVLQKCSSKEAKEEGYLGLAIASNGLEDYRAAIDYASNAIKRSKQKNVMAYYARSVAFQKLGQLDEAHNDLVKITSLTTKNQNTKAQASIFAHLAHLDYQLNRISEGDSNLLRAIDLDPSNPSFFIQQGDIRVRQLQYNEAFQAYDQAMKLGKNDLEIYQIRTEARLKQYQEKYHTNESQVLARVMTSAEKSLLCRELQETIRLGARNMQLELLGSLVCEK